MEELIKNNIYQSLEETCEWFNIEQFEIVKLAGVFQEIIKDQRYIFNLIDIKHSYDVKEFDYIKYREKVYLVEYVEQRKIQDFKYKKITLVVTHYEV